MMLLKQTGAWLICVTLVLKAVDCKFVFFCACSLHCTLSSAAQCIVIGPVCGFVCVCVFVFVGLLPCTITRNCDNSKLRASILKVKVVTSDHLQLIKFWPSRNPGRGSAAGRKFLAPPYYSQHAVFASL